MTNLTPLFTKYVSIIQVEYDDSAKQDYDLKLNRNSNEKQQYKVNDSFIKESKELYDLLTSLNQFTSQIRSPYLSTNDELSSNSKLSNVLTIDDKNKIDQEFEYKIHQSYEKLKILQTYEKKRQDLIQETKPNNFFSSIFGAADYDDNDLFEATINTHRTQILKFLNETANSCNKSFESIKRKRYEREKQLSLLNFQNIEDDLDLNNIDADGVQPFFPHQTNFNDLIEIQELEEKDASTNQYSQQLSQEQIQELDSENHEFLALKTNQLQQVEKLHNSMIDIVSLQAELSYQLETQSDQITNLLDNQSQVEIDLNMGNQNLNKATSSNKKGANMIIATCLILGFLILCVDYISF